MKNFFYSVLVIIFLPLISMSQESQKQEKNEKIVVITPNTNNAMILYIINNKYYLGDTINILIPRLDISKVKRIEQIKDKEMRSKYSKKAGKFSKNIQDVFVIETEEKFEYKVNK